MLAVGFDSSPCCRECHLVADTGEHVLERPLRWGMVEHFYRRHQRQPIPGGAGAETLFLRDVAGLPMSCEQRIQPVAKSVPEELSDSRGIGFLRQQTPL